MTRFILLILFITLLACESQEQKQVTIKISDKVQSLVPLSIYVLQNLEERMLLTGFLDSAGYYSGILPLEKPTLAIIQIGAKYGELYLEPGFNLDIVVNSTKYTVPLQFSGEGDWINQYINEVNGITEATKFSGRKGISELTTTEFKKRIDSLSVSMSQKLNSVKEKNTEQALTLMLQAKNNVKLAAIVQEFKFYKMNRALNQKKESLTGINIADALIESDLQSLSHSIVPFDSSLFSLNSQDHHMLVNFAWHNQVNLPVLEKTRVSDSEASMPILAQKFILGQHYQPFIEQYILAFDLEYRLSREGITTETDTVYSSFKRKYPNSPYQSALSKNYTSWLAIRAGKEAPEFSGETLNGDSISVKSLRGKLLYVDVWATWCAPCRAEILYAKKLRDKFQANSDLEFLNVSVDSDKAAWRNFLASDESWKGTHIIVTSKTYDDLIKKYKLFGVPGYFIIDQQGNIVSVKAGSPSSRKVIEDELTRLLGKKI